MRLQILTDIISIDEHPIKYSSYTAFLGKLNTIAEEAFINNLPFDNEVGVAIRDKFESQDIVESCLLNYEFNLKELGWW